MSILTSLKTALRTQAGRLEFKPGWRIPLSTTASAHHWHNWLGMCQPDQRHAIEIIDRTNARAAPELLRARLAAEVAQPPACVIFCDDLPCPPTLHFALQAHAVGCIHTPMGGNTVTRELLTSLASTLDSVQQHGVFLRVHELGVLLIGHSGTGKSSLALELLERGHALVADDICHFYRMPGTPCIHGVCPSMLYDLLHIDTLGVLNVAKLFGPASSLASHELHLIIELADGYRPGAAQHLTTPPYQYPLLGVTLPQYKFRPWYTQNMALLVETAVKNQVLYRNGYDANAELAQRQQQLLHSI